MAMNRIQFQPGLSMPEFFARFGTEAQCESALVAARWPAGFRCPRCNGSAHCVLGPYWAGKLGRKSLSAFQASSRGGELRVTLAGDRVLIAGKAVTVIKGDLL